MHIHFRRQFNAWIGALLQLLFQQTQGLLGLLAQRYRVGQKACGRVMLAQHACAPALQRGDVQIRGHGLRQLAQTLAKGLHPGV